MNESDKKTMTLDSIHGNHSSTHLSSDFLPDEYNCHIFNQYDDCDYNYRLFTNNSEFSTNGADENSIGFSDMSEPNSISLSFLTNKSEGTSNSLESDSDCGVTNDNVINSFIVNEEPKSSDLPILPGNLFPDDIITYNDNIDNQLSASGNTLYHTNSFDIAGNLSNYLPTVNENTNNFFPVFAAGKDLQPTTSFPKNNEETVRGNDVFVTTFTDKDDLFPCPCKKEKTRKRGKNFSPTAKKIILRLYREIRSKYPNKLIKEIAKEISEILSEKYP